MRKGSGPAAMEIEPKTYKQLCNTKDGAPNGEVMYYHKFPDGSISGRLCPKCQAHLANWEEMFGTSHACP